MLTNGTISVHSAIEIVAIPEEGHVNGLQIINPEHMYTHMYHRSVWNSVDKYTYIPEGISDAIVGILQVIS